METRGLAVSELVRLSVYDKLHWLAYFQGRLDKSFALIDLDLEAAVTPLKAEAKTALIWRQFWVERYAVTL